MGFGCVNAYMVIDEIALILEGALNACRHRVNWQEQDCEDCSFRFQCWTVLWREIDVLR